METSAYQCEHHNSLNFRTTKAWLHGSVVIQVGGSILDFLRNTLQRKGRW